jgi:signal transduction histidine kinase
MRELDSATPGRSLNDLGHLASGVGHHVINAFSAIVSNAEILRLRLKTNPPVDPSAIADLIVQTALDASSVARRLIDFTRPITNIGDDRVRLDHLIVSYLEQARSQSDALPITWETDLQPTPEIRGHENDLQAMLDELVYNAWEARKGDSIQVGFTTSVDARGWVVLEVRDQGQGMTEAVLERAVEPFFTTKASHAGVGLSIANGIWRRHRGTLSLRSVPGDGTTVRLCVEPVAV